MRTTEKEVSDDPILNRIIGLLQQQNRTQKELLEHLGLSSNTFTQWKYQNVKSYMRYIAQIAQFLNVTPNYLIEGIDDEINIETLSADEIDMIKKMRMLQAEPKNHIIGLINLLVSKPLQGIDDKQRG